MFMSSAYTAENGDGRGVDAMSSLYSRPSFTVTEEHSQLATMARPKHPAWYKITPHEPSEAEKALLPSFAYPGSKRSNWGTCK